MKHAERRRWTQEELEQIRVLYAAAPWEQILGAIQNRTLKAIQRQAYLLGSKREVWTDSRVGNKQLWRKEELKSLRTLFPTAPKKDILERFPKRTWGTIKGKANRLGIQRQKPWRERRERHEVIKCESCGKTLKVMLDPRREHRRYCSRTCAARGAGVPRRRRVSQVCKGCLTTFYVRPSNLRNITHCPQCITRRNQRFTAFMKRTGVRHEGDLYVGRCEVCGRDWRGPNPRQKTCSHRCTDALLTREIRTPRQSADYYAWWLGALAGDGSTVNRKRVSLEVIDRDFARFFAKIGEEVFGIHPKVRKHFKAGLTCAGEPYPPRYRVDFHSVAMARLLGEWGDLSWPQTLQQRFSWLLRKPYTEGFLSGFCDAEGSVVPHGRTYSISIAVALKPNRLRQELIVKMLHLLGFAPGGIGSRKLTLSSIADVARFALIWDSKITRKRERLQKAKRLKSSFYIPSEKELEFVRRHWETHTGAWIGKQLGWHNAKVSYHARKTLLLPSHRGARSSRKTV